jgi:hypothetical protein
VNTLAQHKLSPEQYLLLYLLATDDRNLDAKLFYEPNYRDSKGNEVEINRLRKISNIYLYAEQVRTWSKQEILDLIDRGYLSGTVDTATYPDMLTITNKTKEMILGDPYMMSMQLWEAYPDYFSSNGNNYPAKTPSMGAEALMEKYAKMIKHDPRVHKFVMDTLRTLIKSNSVSVGIEKWVINRYWEVENRRIIEQSAKSYGTNIL